MQGEIGDVVVVSRGRGRPPKGGVPLTDEAKKDAAAARKRAQRERDRVSGLVTLSIKLDAEMLAAVEKFRQFKDETQASVVERALKNFLRKR